MKALLPVPVFDAIAGHLRRCGRRAHHDWEANQAHEDSLTGGAFAEFRTRRVHVDGQEWLWRVTVRKFGNGGHRSEERLADADGIIEIDVRHTATGRIESKGLLVQAKKNWAGKNTRLLGQVGDMERLAPGSFAAIDYSQAAYTGIDGRSVLVAEGDRRRVDDAQDVPLGDFLADRFLSCEVGLRRL